MKVPEQPKPQPTVVTPVTKAPERPQAAYVPVGSAKAFIYQKESGNNPLAINKSSGACGIGQALPCSKLLAVCPQLSDYACQDRFFTQYMLGRYKTWEAARNWWLSHRWW